ncbi:fumarylacetoacetate hydrolase family protein [Nanoarchaeota archaeon]
MSNLDFLKPFPSKIVCIGLNYKSHAEEVGIPLPEEPLFFLKPTSSLIGDGDTIILPKESEKVEFEAELACIVGEKMKNTKPEEVLGKLKGFICCNDITARDLQKKDNQWTRAKGFDTFCAVGPKIVPVDAIDPNNAKIQSYLNGELKQDSMTSEFIFKLEEAISYVSHIMTLMPGDIISTGSPPGVCPMKSGDEIEVRIEGVGSLKNKCE